MSIKTERKNIRKQWFFFYLLNYFNPVDRVSSTLNYFISIVVTFVCLVFCFYSNLLCRFGLFFFSFFAAVWTILLFYFNSINEEKNGHSWLTFGKQWMLRSKKSNKLATMSSQKWTYRTKRFNLTDNVDTKMFFFSLDLFRFLPCISYA